MTNKTRIGMLENEVNELKLEKVQFEKTKDRLWSRLNGTTEQSNNMLLQLTKLTAKVNKLEVELGEIER